jgi:hypothetical protein
LRGDPETSQSIGSSPTSRGGFDNRALEAVDRPADSLGSNPGVLEGLTQNNQ